MEKEGNMLGVFLVAFTVWQMPVPLLCVPNKASDGPVRLTTHRDLFISVMTAAVASTPLHITGHNIRIFLCKY